MDVERELKNMRAQLQEARLIIQNQQEQLQSLTTPPFSLVTALRVLPNTVVTKDMELPKPKNVIIYPGDKLRLSEAGGIVDVVGVNPGGEIFVIDSVADTDFVEVVSDRGKAWVLAGKYDGKLKVGDRVVLDDTASVVVGRLPKSKAVEERFAFVEPTNVKWADIGGLTEAKKELREVIEEPERYAVLYSRFKKKRCKGILLHGFPGNGKTMLAKASASAIAQIYGSDAPGFMYIRGPEILSKWVGETEQIIRAIFEQGRLFHGIHGYPPIIFIDEADALLSKRGSRFSSDVERTIVPMFLAEMDGLGTQGGMVLLATNLADSLDEAVVREGRIDKKIKVCRPSLADAEEIFAVHLKQLPVKKNGEALHKLAAAELFSQNYPLYQLLTHDGAHEFRLEHLVSGAMIAGIVQTAIQLAIRRAIREDLPTRESWVEWRDVKEAVQSAFEQNRGMNHEMYLKEHVQELGIDLAKIQRAEQRKEVLSAVSKV